MDRKHGTNRNLPNTIFFSSNPKEALRQVIDELAPDRVVFLCDENTKKDCLSLFELPKESDVIEIKSGEIHKNLETCQHVWLQLTTFGLTRNSLLVNVGGGVIGDLGGFCAATYKRGIRFINFPTTLLAMVDANIGGKLGIDFEGYKNHIGVFQDPERVIIHTPFLKTLSFRELRSGYAEVLKHGLIRDRAYWELAKNSTLEQADWASIVQRSAELKHDVVSLDPKESGLRKILNFGHTLGHAVETTYLNNGVSLLHGEAIAAGMILEAFLSFKQGFLTAEELDDITHVISGTYGIVEIPDLKGMMPLMLQDKKNKSRTPSFSLLDGIGKCRFDVQVSEEALQESIRYYTALK